MQHRNSPLSFRGELFPVKSPSDHRQRPSLPQNSAFIEKPKQKNDSDVISMAGSRPLTPREERFLLRHIRRINARDRALISAQMFLGFRISEIFMLTIGHVVHHGAIRNRVALPPRFLKGIRGSMRTVPIGQELRGALERYLF